jgi:hypothetical protein
MSLPVFQHPCYAVVEDDHVVRIAYHKGASLPPPAEEDASLVEAVSAYTRALLISRFQLQQRWIPSENSPARCDILLSPNWDSCETLVLVLQNQFGAQPGVWSRSACVSQGLRKGSMLSLLQGCKAAGYGWIIANANCNSVVLEKGRGKEPIEGSASPEEHVLSVYESYVRQTAATHLLLLGYGHGAVLCKEILQVRPVRCRGRGNVVEQSRQINQRRSCIHHIALCPYTHPAPLPLSLLLHSESWHSLLPPLLQVPGSPVSPCWMRVRWVLRTTGNMADTHFVIHILIYTC